MRLHGEHQVGQRSQRGPARRRREGLAQRGVEGRVLDQDRAHPGLGEEGDGLTGDHPRRPLIDAPQHSQAGLAQAAGARRGAAGGAEALPVQDVVGVALRARERVLAEHSALAQHAHELMGAAQRQVGQARRAGQREPVSALIEAVDEALLRRAHPAQDDGVARLGSDLALARAPPQDRGRST
ncbi:hypothetical protein ADENT20671_1092 [Actinomyces denticolens]|nr:hypothetical protein ADENT20671_1092 [Actinomyces denticolens]